MLLKGGHQSVTVSKIEVGIAPEDNAFRLWLRS